MALYFIFSAIESFFVGIFLLSIGSEDANQLLLNSSPSRLLTSAFLFLIAIALLFLAVVSIRRHYQKDAFLSNLLTTRKSLLLLSIIALLISALSAYILTRNQHFGGDLRQVIQQLKPVFAWALALSSQALFFILLWFSTFFVLHKEKKTIYEVKHELLPVFAIFILAAVVKWLTVTAGAFGPTGRGDEMTYYDMIDSFHRGFFSVSQTHHYPPLYALTLLPALTFGQYTYAIIKFINVLVSTSIVFPTYLISRSFMNQKRSLIPALIACLIPYHMVIPMRMVSENLYFPIFLWVNFMVLKKPVEESDSLFWDILTGIWLGLLYLTRYISLMIIPMFMIAWWLKPFEASDRIFKPSWKKMLRLLMIGLIAVVVFSPWIIGGLLEDVPVKLTLGFGITERTNPEQLTLKNLLTWILLYGLYIVMLAAPTLPIVFKSIASLFSKDWREKYGRFALQIFILLGGFITASTRHSWRAFYNDLVPSRIMGRYVLYLLVPFISLAFIGLDALQQNQTNKNSKKDTLLVSGAFLLVVLAYFTIVDKSVIRLGSNFLQPLGSFDAYYAGVLGIVFFLFMGALYIAYWFFFRKANQKLFIAISLIYVLFYISGWSAFRTAIKPYQQYPFLSSEVAEFARDVLPAQELEGGISLLVPRSADMDQKAELYNGLRVRDIDNTRIDEFDADKPVEISTSSGFIIHESPCDELDGNSISRSAIFLDQEYCIELITE